MADKEKEVVEEKKAPKADSPKTFDLKAWKNRKLRFVNEMADKAKAESIAKRILQHK